MKHEALLRSCWSYGGTTPKAMADGARGEARTIRKTLTMGVFFSKIQISNFKVLSNIGL
jgi:hypothetical protein